MVIIFPLTTGEDLAVRWGSRVIPVLAAVVVLLLGAISAGLT